MVDAGWDRVPQSAQNTVPSSDKIYTLLLALRAFLAP